MQLKLDISWALVVSFTLQLLYPRIKNTRYTFGRGLGAPQNRS
jgi:hypothetical protein